MKGAWEKQTVSNFAAYWVPWHHSFVKLLRTSMNMAQRRASSPTRRLALPVRKLLLATRITRVLHSIRTDLRELAAVGHFTELDFHPQTVTRDPWRVAGGRWFVVVDDRYWRLIHCCLTNSTSKFCPIAA